MHTEPIETQSLTSYLRGFFNSQVLKNDSYSVRAFAKDLSIHPSTLSHLMNYKRDFTPLHQERIASFFKLPLEEIKKMAEIKDFETLPKEVFHTINQWYFDVILDLIHLTDFEPTVDYISHKIGISNEEAKSAIDILFKHELIKENPNKTWTLVKKNTSILNTSTAEAKRELQKQITEKGLEAIQTRSLDERYHYSITLSGNSNDLEIAKQKIRDFGRELNSFLQRQGRNHDEVYTMQVGFFPNTLEKRNA